MPRAQGCAGAAISRLVALVPKPRVNLTRYHSAGESDRTSYAQRKQQGSEAVARVFAPNSKYRALVTPAKRGKGKKGIAAQQQPDPTSAERRAWPRPASRPVPGLTFSMTWPFSHILVLHGTRTS
jgi:hypothetical protein